MINNLVCLLYYVIRFTAANELVDINVRVRFDEVEKTIFGLGTRFFPKRTQHHSKSAMAAHPSWERTVAHRHQRPPPLLIRF